MVFRIKDFIKDLCPARRKEAALLACPWGQQSPAPSPAPGEVNEDKKTFHVRSTYVIFKGDVEDISLISTPELLYLVRLSRAPLFLLPSQVDDDANESNTTHTQTTTSTTTASTTTSMALPAARVSGHLEFRASFVDDDAVQVAAEVTWPLFNAGDVVF